MQRFGAAPAGHGGGLDGFVGGLAGKALVGQCEQDALRKDEALRFVEVGLHVLGIDDLARDEVGGELEHVTEQLAAIGKDDPLDGGVGDVALVPERHVFERRDRIAANNAREAAKFFAGDGIALVRHGAAALLAGGEIFLDLEDFGALEMAEFGGPLVDAAGDERERVHEMRVAVALDDLGREQRRA